MKTMSRIKAMYVRYKNRLAREKQYYKDIKALLDEGYSDGEAQSIMWCREHGFADDGSGFSNRPTLTVIQGGKA